MPRTALSPLDFTMPNTYAHQILFFPTTSLKSIDTLKRALEATCSRVPVFNGKLTVDKSGRPPVIFHGQYSVLKMLTFHDFAADVDYEDLKTACIQPEKARTPTLAEAVRVLSVIPPYSLQSEGEAPTLRLTMAKLRGGMVMTLNFHHLVFDMTSMAVFLRTLSACCRGETPTSLPGECLSRDILSALPTQDYEYHLAALNDQFRPVKKTVSSDTQTVTNEAEKPAPRVSAMIHLSASALQRLKEDAKAAIDQSDRHVWISTHDVLFALFWSCITTASSKYDGAANKEKSTICMAVNLRRRLSPPLPDDYLGAAVCAPTLSAPLELLRLASTSYASLAQLSLLMRAKVTTIDADYIRRCFDTTSPPDPNEQDPPTFDPAQPIDFAVNSWAEQGACLHDWGKDLGACELALRLYARSPSVYVMPKLPSGGGLYVHTTLEVETMERLRRSEMFAKYATW